MNKKQFVSLIRLLEPKLFGFAFRILRDEDQVKDAMQELMLRIWRNRKKLKENQNIPAYCFRTLHNLCIDALRYSGRHLVTDLEGEQSAFSTLQSESAEALHEWQDLVERVQTVMLTLPVTQRAIIELHDFQEFSHAEIAEMLGMEINAVRTNLSRARARITSQIRKEEVYES